MTQTLKGVFTVATQSSFSWSEASISTIQQPQWFSLLLGHLLMMRVRMTTRKDKG